MSTDPQVGEVWGNKAFAWVIIGVDYIPHRPTVTIEFLGLRNPLHGSCEADEVRGQDTLPICLFKLIAQFLVKPNTAEALTAPHSS
jgi:hypothetical protein